MRLTKKSKSTSYQDYIEANVISCDAGYRGGNVKVDVSSLFPEIVDEEPVIGAYQNYLGGGMLGAIAGASMFNFDDLTSAHRVIADQLKEECKKYLHFQTNHDDEFEFSSYEDNQKRPVSAY